MSSSHTVERLKEIIRRYQTIRKKFITTKITADNRAHFARIQKNTFSEIEQLIERL